MNESKPPQSDANDTTSLTASITQALSALSEQVQTSDGQLRTELQRAQEALAAVEGAANEQQDLITNALRDLRSQEVQLAERISARLAESAGATQKAAALERSLEEARAASQEAEAKAVAHGQHAAEAQQSAEAAKQRCTELQRQLDEQAEAVQRAESLAQELEEAQTTIEALRTEIAAKDEDEFAGAERVRQLEDELAARNAELEEAQTTIGSLRTAVEAKEEEDVAAAERVRQLEQEVGSLRGAAETHSVDDDALQAEAEGLRTEVKALQLELNETRGAVAEADALRAELAGERQRIAELEERLETEISQGKESALASQLSEALRAREEAEERLAAFQRETESAANAEGPELERVKAGMRVPDLSTAAELVEDLELGGGPAEEPTRGVLDVPGADQDGRKRHIGQILLDAGSITRAQLDECLDIQRSSPNRHLGEILINQGFVSDDVVAQAISRQSGIDYVRIGSSDINPDVLSILGKKLATLHRCIPLRSDGETLTLAMENPLDLIAIEDVERATQLTVNPVAAPRGEILLTIQDYYGES